MSSSNDKDVESAALIDSKNDAIDSSPPDDKKKGGSGKALSSCALYGFCSVSMVLVNKSLASSYNQHIDGDLNFLLVVFQAIIAIIAVEFCKKMQWVEYPSFNTDTALKWAPVNLFFCAMLFTGMTSLQHNSVPMVTVFKNITNIGVAVGDYYFFGTPAELMVVVAFGVMLGGALLAAKNDAHMTFLGVFWMITNCMATAGYILYMKFATKNVKLSKFGMVFYNNVLCAFFLFPVTLINGEMSTFLKTGAIHTFDYMAKNSFAGFVGFFLNFASLNCVANTGATTYAIVGSMNKIPIAILGWFLFDNVISPQTWFFISVSMSGGFFYSYAKLTAGKRKARKQLRTG